ncbi:MAG: sulfate adenylyltransferase subunit 1 [Crocinitomicaceae bacterium]
MKIIKFLTAGNVDDGKSTLIGRLLHDTGSLKRDQIEFVRNLSKNNGELNYALFTDGLSSEREQGITIDVSYQYFSYGKSRFIIADCPGHVQYTRNMITGASQSDVFVLLVNANKSIQHQTIQHFRIAELLRMSKVIVCVNKMDLVDYSEEIFNQIKSEINKLNQEDLLNIEFIPICATNGDNITSNSNNMTWYKGNSLINALELVSINNESASSFRFPIQLVEAVNSRLSVDRFVYGSVAGGSLEVGERVSVMPSGLETRVKAIFKYDKHESIVLNKDYCTLLLEDNVDVSRGNVLVKTAESKVPQLEFLAKLCWLDSKPLNINSKYLVKVATAEVTCQFFESEHSDKNRMNQNGVKMNDLFTSKIVLANSVLVDTYAQNKALGSFIVIDSVTNNTVAAGIITKD